MAAQSNPLGRRPGPAILASCGRARLSSDVSEIKLVFSIPPHRPTLNIAPSWNEAPTRAIKARLDGLARDFDRLADAADSGALAVAIP
jgi:hypothetical protein